MAYSASGMQAWRHVPASRPERRGCGGIQLDRACTSQALQCPWPNKQHAYQRLTGAAVQGEQPQSCTDHQQGARPRSPEPKENIEPTAAQVSELAFLGDAIWSLLVRRAYLSPPKAFSTYRSAAEVHVSAEAQASCLDGLQRRGCLLPEESSWVSAALRAQTQSTSTHNTPRSGKGTSESTDSGSSTSSDGRSSMDDSSSSMDGGVSGGGARVRRRFLPSSRGHAGGLHAYRKATALEALVGLLWSRGSHDRLAVLWAHVEEGMMAGSKDQGQQRQAQ